MWVKICANTNLEDALSAVRLGADAVGFVFAPSARQVTPAEVAEISASLPAGVERVGVFGRASAGEIASAAATAGLSAVQLHFAFDGALTRDLVALAPGLEIIHTVGWAVDDPESAARVSAELGAIASSFSAHRVLVDTKLPGASGGTGRTFDWGAAARVLHAWPGLRIIVAGGLRPENVATAIETLRPWGVDVASGVEREPGRKSEEKLTDFLRNARG